MARDAAAGRQVGDMGPDAVGVAVGTSPGRARSRCGLAARATTDLSELADLMAQGQLAESTVALVARETRDADPEAVAAVVAHLLAPLRGRPGSVRVTGLEPREVARACRRVIQRAAPDLLAERVARNRRERLDVRLTPGPVGTSALTAVLPTELAMVLQAAVDEAGAARRADDPDLPVGAARAWGLADLTLRGVEVRAQVRLGVPVITSAASRLGLAPLPTDRQSSAFAPTGGGEQGMSGEPVASRIVTGDGVDMVDVLPEEWTDGAVTSQVPTTFGPGGQVGWVGGCEIPGVGYIPPDAVAAITTHLHTQVSRALLDARTGTLLETSTPRYVLPQSLLDVVTARDGTCRMWGCNRRVRGDALDHRADVDHATPWPAGGSTPGNLSALCRHHHRVKHAPRWTHRLHPDGTTEWITPGGVPAITFPDHTVHLPDDPAHEHSAETETWTPPSPPPTGAKALADLTAGPPPF